MVSARRIAIVAALLVARSTVVRADADDATAESEFRLGYRALQAGNCGEALVHYRRSLELVQRPRTLFNIAACEEALGQNGPAWRDYQAFLSLAEDRDATIVVDARARIEALRKRVRGQVSVSSTPTSASVTVDGERQSRGDTPITLSLEPGRHTLELSMPGMPASARVVDVSPEGQTTLQVELALPSSISIHADPADATIESRGDGTTAIGHLDMPVLPGHHAFEIRRRGYTTEVVDVDASTGRVHDLRVNLRPELAKPAATLIVNGAGGATIAIDGTSRELRNLRALPPGPHEISLAQGGRVVWRRDLQLSPSEIVRLDVNLSPPRSMTRRALTWSVGGFGLASIAAGSVVGSLALRDVTSDSVADHERGKTRAIVADGLFVVGAAALVVAWRLLRNDPTSATITRETGTL